VAEIPKNRLTEAETHFRALAQKPASLSNRDIDWTVVKNQLKRLASALAQNDRGTFDEAFAMLKTRLSLANVLRGEIGPASARDSSIMPPEVLELINHLVDKLHIDLSKPSEKEHKEEAK